MTDKIIEEGAEFELNGVKCRILSVGEHNVEGEPAGYSYSFRPVEDIEKDEELAQQAEKARAAERAEEAEKRAQAEAEAQSEEIFEVESENSPEGSDEKTTQENSLPLN